MSTVQENSKQKTLLILDFDQTISEGDLDFFKGKRDLNYRSEELERVDEFTSKEVNILTTQDVDEFIAKYPILMKKKLCSIIKDIIDNDHTVMIASFTEHPKALRYIIDKHLGLEKEYLEKINLISYGPDHYHGFDASLSEDEEEHRAGKNLHIIEGIKLFKKNNNGELPLRLILASSNNTTVARCNHIINEAKGRAIPEFQKYFAEALGYEVSDYYRMKKSPEFIDFIYTRIVQMWVVSLFDFTANLNKSKNFDIPLNLTQHRHISF